MSIPQPNDCDVHGLETGCGSKLALCILLAYSAFCTGVSAEEANASQATKTADDNSTGLFEFSTQSILNSAEAGALGLVIKFAEPISSARRRHNFGIGNNIGVIDIMPELDISTGDNGTFQSIVAKVTGGVYYADRDQIVYLEDGSPIVIHNLPISLGVETTRHFDSFAVLGEIGWVPFVDINEPSGSSGENYYLGINPRFGIYLQGGYKFDGGGPAGVGASSDNSSEAEHDYLLRAKASLDFEMTDIASWDLGPLEVDAGVFGHARGWYDIANNDWYHSVGVTLRLQTDDANNRYFDLSVKNGSGEPNFAPGTQFSAGLTVSY